MTNIYGRPFKRVNEGRDLVSFNAKFGENVTLGHNVIIDDYCEIGDNVFIGSDVKILPNVRIGNNVVIGTGSVVTKDIPDNVVIAGIPAKIISSIADYKNKVLSRAVFSDESNRSKRKEIILKDIEKESN